MPSEIDDILVSLEETVRAAARDRRRLRIVGGGSKDFLGTRDDAAEPVDVTGLRGIVSYEPAELVMRVRAGTPLAEVERALAEEGQMLGFEPPHFAGAATMGGVAAAGISGPRRPWYGSVRDFVLGIEMITGEGRRVAFGGQVMKNVAGYDVSRLVTGAMGTLGLITEVSLKVLPRPAREITIVKESDAESALSVTRSLARRATPLSGTCYQEGRLYLRLSGSESAVRRMAAELKGEECDNGIWTDIANLRLPIFTQCESLWRVSVPPGSDLFLHEADAIEWGGAQRWLADPNVDPRDTLGDSSGHATRYRGSGTASAFHPLSGPVEQIHRNLKAHLDPAGILNYGRMYEGL